MKKLITTLLIAVALIAGITTTVPAEKAHAETIFTIQSDPGDGVRP